MLLPTQGRIEELDTYVEATYNPDYGEFTE
jgi:hypothetical protein